jgi:hypothetical protein
MRNENDVKKLVRAVLDAEPPNHIWYFMPSANGFGRQGIPDFVGMHKGRMFAIETKFGNNDLTPYQLREVTDIIRAGGRAWIVRDTTLDGFRAEFREWVDLHNALTA